MGRSEGSSASVRNGQMADLRNEDDARRFDGLASRMGSPLFGYGQVFP
jgi:hypothetical protein